MPQKDSNLSAVFGSMFHALPGLYLVLTPDLVIQHATDAFLETTLSSRENIIGRYFFDVFPNNPSTPQVDSANLFKQSLQFVLEHRQEHHMAILRYDIPRPQGGFEERYWSPVNRPILDTAGNMRYILHEAKDITAQVLSEQEQLHHQERLYMLTDALHAVSWEYDMANNRISWGKGLQEVFGYLPEDMGPGGESWHSRVHPDDYPRVEQGIQQATANGDKVWSSEYRFLKADGTYAHVLDQGFIVYDANGQPARTIGSIIDLSLSKSSEQSLKESDARFWHLLEVLPHMAWMADSKGRLTYFNSNWYDYTGMRPGQVDGWINVVHPEDSAQLLAAWQEATQSGQVFESEYRIRNHSTGEYRWFLERGVPMYDAQRNIQAWIGSYADIEEQKNAYNQVLRKDQYLEKVLNASPAHLCLLEGPDYVCRYITPGFHRVYGNRQYLGKPARAIWPEYTGTKFWKRLDEVYHHLRIVSIDAYEIAYDRHKAGQKDVAYLNFKYQPLLDDEGKAEGVLISAIEVTELVELKKQLTELQNKISS
ncbi:PAS domain-containing protein [Pontibacter akesuensis]|uniref:histidine kinase n=1 Tax=Pontibacter akesuensis TaxID=388950 RepID=A0A1I7IEL5_9BACT|nr:PAS domain-containing protein [Pontibacter akesuensis]GHA66816.1 hypothetical protein GCM10007389_19870 [Pontibacter akesuensis]SFU71375.1 PAS domain S-box-containing protein [Pontibacter akesuensis]